MHNSDPANRIGINFVARAADLQVLTNNLIFLNSCLKIFSTSRLYDSYGLVSGNIA